MRGEQRGYRVVYLDGERTRSFGDIAAGVASRQTLDPFHSRLLLAGVEGGEIVLVDKETGRVVVRRAVRPYRGRFRGSPHAPHE
jgi:hypothetical protein